MIKNDFLKNKSAEIITLNTKRENLEFEGIANVRRY
jgi:hypothetical protein